MIDCLPGMGTALRMSKLRLWRGILAEERKCTLDRTPPDQQFKEHRGDRGWLSHGLVVTVPISYSLDGGTMWGFTRDMRIAD